MLWVRVHNWRTYFVEGFISKVSGEIRKDEKVELEIHWSFRDSSKCWHVDYELDFPLLTFTRYFKIDVKEILLGWSLCDSMRFMLVNTILTFEEVRITFLDMQVRKLRSKELVLVQVWRKGYRGYVGEWVWHVNQIYTLVLSV